MELVRQEENNLLSSGRTWYSNGLGSESPEDMVSASKLNKRTLGSFQAFTCSSLGTSF